MGPSERLKIAGEAAELLEEMGFVSVARLRDGIVTLECWDRLGKPPKMVTHVVDEEAITKQLLASACAGALRGADPDAS
jgi:hypothetical protein